MTKLRFLIGISVIAALVCTVTCHNHAESPGAKYRLDPYAVLAQFSSDELSVHSRRRRDQLDSLNNIVYQMEDLSKECTLLEYDDGNSEHVVKLTSSLAILKTEYCFYARLNQEHSFITELTGRPISKYRTYNGEYNNPFNPRWGSSDYPTVRLLAAIYEDGSYKLRKMSVSALEVSRKFVGHDEIFDRNNGCELVMHFGQFLDHDLALTPHLEADCSSCNETKECLPIDCYDNNTLCAKRGCMKFARTRPAVESHYACDTTNYRPHCRTHPNVITSFVDASNVYGSYEQTAHELRRHEHGLLYLREGDDPNTEDHIHLLLNDDENKACNGETEEHQCGKGGDIRAAEQPVLTALHTIFANEHNRIARELKKMHSCWDDETLFQEARRILIAIMQKIVYGEWLPLVIGSETMEDYGLELWHDYRGYDSSVNPTIFNDFAAAFFRFGHSMAPEVLKRVNEDWEDVHDDIDLKDSFFNASVVHDLGNGGIKSLVLGTVANRLLAIDRHVSRSIHEHLFENFEEGLDLVALNIQRGRDHGLPGYIKYRELCGFGNVSSFADLKTDMDVDALKALINIYDNVADVEPFVGMLAEKPKDGALVGKTLACILGKQFHNLRYGDSYWFENDLNSEQLKAIRKVTMARIICDNVFVKTIQPAAFKMMSEEETGNDVYFYQMINDEGSKGYSNDFVNSRVSCHNTEAIPNLDLSAWKEEVPNKFYGFYNN